MKPEALHPLVRHVDRLISGKRQLVVAYSGGLDSTVLLDLLYRRQLSSPQATGLRAVHIHHGLSQLADDWLVHCRHQCLLRQIPFIALRVEVNRQQGGVEAAARSARYAALGESLMPGDVLLTAQHQDDQAETLLLALKRGSGPAGLSSMPATAILRQHELLRPLLDISREQLEAYARHYQLSWIEDDSNADERFDRNFLRLHVMPLLQQRWPQFNQSVSRSAQLCAEQEALLDELLSETLSSLIQQDGSVSIAPMLTMNAPRRAALLRRWLSSAGVRMPSRTQLERLWNEVALSRADASPRLQLGHHQLRRFRDSLYLLPLWPSLKHQVLQWSEWPQPLKLPQDLGIISVSGPDTGQWVRAPAHTETVSIRFDHSGPLYIVGRHHRRPIKKIWQELGIAPWLRERTPMLFYNQQLIAVLGVFVTRDGEARQGREGCGVVWQQQDHQW